MLIPRIAMAASLIFISGCASSTSTPSSKSTTTSTPSATLRELFPSIRIDTAAKFVEFDGTVCIDAKDPNQPAGVPLECYIVTPTSGKEHESLILTKAKASNIHAALLMLGHNNGTPGTFQWQGKERGMTSVPPTGDALVISVSYADKPFENLGLWAMHMDGQPMLPDNASAAWWAFAGSHFVPFKGSEVYEADMTGIVAGLCTFGGEVLAWPDTISPDSTMVEPDFIASRERVPPFGTPVRVRVQTRN